MSSPLDMEEPEFPDRVESKKMVDDGQDVMEVEEETVEQTFIPAIDTGSTTLKSLGEQNDPFSQHCQTSAMKEYKNTKGVENRDVRK